MAKCLCMDFVTLASLLYIKISYKIMSGKTKRIRPISMCVPTVLCVCSDGPIYSRPAFT